MPAKTPATTTTTVDELRAKQKAAAAAVAKASAEAKRVAAVAAACDGAADSAELAALKAEEQFVLTELKDRKDNAETTFTRLVTEGGTRVTTGQLIAAWHDYIAATRTFFAERDAVHQRLDWVDPIPSGYTAAGVELPKNRYRPQDRPTEPEFLPTLAKLIAESVPDTSGAAADARLDRVAKARDNAYENAARAAQ